MWRRRLIFFVYKKQNMRWLTKKCTGQFRVIIMLIWDKFQLWIRLGVSFVYGRNQFQFLNFRTSIGFLAIKGKWHEETELINLVNVYSSCVLLEKRLLWEKILQLKNDWGRVIWYLAGDYNEVREAKKKRGIDNHFPQSS